MLSGCIPSHVGLCDKVLMQVQAAASMEFGVEVKLVIPAKTNIELGLSMNRI